MAQCFRASDWDGIRCSGRVYYAAHLFWRLCIRIGKNARDVVVRCVGFCSIFIAILAFRPHRGCVENKREEETREARGGRTTKENFAGTNW